MKKYATLILMALLLTAVAAVPLMAQDQKPAGKSQEELDRIEYDAYMAGYNAFNTEKNLPKALNLAKEYLAKYPSGKYLEYAKSLKAGALDALFADAYQKQNFDQAFTYAKELMEANPNEVALQYRIVATGNTLVKQKKFEHAADIKANADKVRQAIEGGAKPTGFPDDQWAKAKNAWLSDSYQTLGIIARQEEKHDEAIAHLTKAGEANPTDPITFVLLGGIYSAKYQAASQAYDKLTDDEKVSDAGKAALENVYKEADQVIDAYARVLALTDGKPGFDGIRGQVQPTLVSLYKFRHEENPEGWQELVNKYKAANTQPVQK